MIRELMISKMISLTAHLVRPADGLTVSIEGLAVAIVGAEVRRGTQEDLVVA